MSKGLSVRAAEKPKQRKQNKSLTDNQMKIYTWEIMQKYQVKPHRGEITSFSENVPSKLRKINNEAGRLIMATDILRRLNDALALNHQDTYPR